LKRGRKWPSAGRTNAGPGSPEVGFWKSNIRATESGKIVPGALTPVLARHSKSFSLIDCISVGVDRMQRNFEPMRRQVETWQKSELTDVTAKVVIYEAFVEGELEAPKHLARSVHDLYFEPKYEEFRPRTIWSLSNAFTSAFKELDPIPQFHNSRPRPNWVNSWRPASHNRSSPRGGVGRPPLFVDRADSHGLLPAPTRSDPRWVFSPEFPN
jgi:hypothetical protein